MRRSRFASLRLHEKKKSMSSSRTLHSARNHQARLKPFLVVSEKPVSMKAEYVVLARCRKSDNAHLQSLVA